MSKKVSSKSEISFDTEVWVERLNFISKFKRFCQLCTSRYEFWLSVGFFALLEPILCSRWPVGWVLLAQVIVLAISTFLYVIQLVGVASREWDKIIMIEAMSSLQSLAIPKNVMDFTLLKLFIFFTAEGEYILEFACLIFGWILIFWHPGLAALRCFRPFRLLWFYEVEIFRSRTEYYFNPLFGEVFVSRGFRVLKFAIKSLSALGNEMFRLTNETKGGLLLMMIFFYSAFVLGASLWVETEGTNTACLTVGSCMFVLMRLTFFDGTGFDFAYSLTASHRILFFVVMMYMCLTSFGILNGLVGIFGTAFAHASDLAFEDEENHQFNVAMNNEVNQNGSGGGGGNGNSGGGGGQPIFSSEGQSGKSEDEFVQSYSPDVEMNGGGGGGSSKVKTSGFETAEDLHERHKQVATMVAGGSKFAMKELMKPSNLQGQARRMTFKDLVKKSTSPVAAGGLRYANPGQVDPALPSESNANMNNASMYGNMYAAASSNELNRAAVFGDRPKKAGGMFSRQKSTKNGLVPIAGSTAQMFGGQIAANAASSHQMITMASQMTSLQGKVDRQSETISGLVDHIAQLTKLLESLHPQLGNPAPPLLAPQHVEAKEEPRVHVQSHHAGLVPIVTTRIEGEDSPEFSPVQPYHSYSTSGFPSPEKRTSKFKGLVMSSSTTGGSASATSSHGNSVENVQQLISGLPSMTESLLGEEDDEASSRSAVKKFTTKDAAGSLYNVNQ